MVYWTYYYVCIISLHFTSKTWFYRRFEIVHFLVDFSRICRYKKFEFPWFFCCLRFLHHVHFSSSVWTEETVAAAIDFPIVIACIMNLCFEFDVISFSNTQWASCSQNFPIYQFWIKSLKITDRMINRKGFEGVVGSKDCMAACHFSRIDWAVAVSFCFSPAWRCHCYDGSGEQRWLFFSFAFGRPEGPPNGHGKCGVCGRTDRGKRAMRNDNTNHLNLRIDCFERHVARFCYWRCCSCCVPFYW